MEEKSLALSFGNSLTEEVADCVGEFAELGLDSIMEEGLLKDIPFISTAISIYRIGNTIHDRQYVKKLAIFIDEINKSVADETRLKVYREKFHNNDKFRCKELEFVMVLIDRYIGLEKPRMFAKLYLAYLDKKITWILFSEYAEILDRLLSSDIECLFLFMCRGGVTTVDDKDVSVESVLRLSAVGFVEQVARMTWGEATGEMNKRQKITDYGRVFAEICAIEMGSNRRKEMMP